MTAGIERDLIADMAVCDAASSGFTTHVEVFTCAHGPYTETQVFTEDYEQITEADETFIIEAREGWAHAIRRALAAEAKWDALKTRIYTDHNELQTCTLAMYELRRLIRLIERLETEGGNANDSGN